MTSTPDSPPRDTSAGPPSLEPFRADPLMRFFLSRRALFTPLAFLLAYVLLGFCSYLDGTFFEIPTGDHRYPSDVLLVPFVKEPFSPVFVFIFYTFLILYARWLNRRIRDTLVVLYQRGILREDARPSADYHAAFQRRFDSRWAYSLTVFLSTWFLLVWTFARLGFLDESLKVVIYITARDSQLAFAWIVVFCIVGPHLFMSVVWRIIVCSYLLNRTFSRFHEIRLQPLHPDRCCGLGFVGKFTLLMSGFVVFYPLFLALLSAFYPQFVGNPVTEVILIYSGAVFYVAIASFVFVYPTYSAHTLMAREREEALKVLNRRFFSLYEDVFSKIDADGIETQQLDEQIKLLNNIREYYREVGGRAIWPYDVRVISQFAGIIGIPLFLMFVDRLTS